MILLIGIKTDPVLQYFFSQAFVKRDRRILFINVHRIGKDIFLSDKGWLLPCGATLLHTEIRAVYNRMLSGVEHPMCYYLNWLLDEYYPNVINRPKHTLTNFSKIWQLNVAKRFGLQVPPTQVLANNRLHGIQKYIYKSISAKRSIVQKVDQNRRRTVHEPVLFQRDQGRENIRVHLLKGWIVAQKIVSTEVDYRYDLHASYAAACVIPKQLGNQLRQLANHLGLIFSGADFMRLDGQYYFLEMNPSPGYAYFEKQLMGVPISKKLYRFLKQDE